MREFLQTSAVAFSPIICHTGKELVFHSCTILSVTEKAKCTRDVNIKKVNFENFKFVLFWTKYFSRTWRSNSWYFLKFSYLFFFPSDFNMLSSRSSSHHHPNRHHHHEQQNHHESRLSRSGGHHHSQSTTRSGGSSSYHHQQHSQSSYRTSRDRYDDYAVRSPTEEGKLL